MVQEKWLNQLATKGYAFSDSLISRELSSSLSDLAISLNNDNKYVKAKIGRSLDKELVPQVRKSDIYWIEDWSTPLALNEYGKFLQNLINDLNKFFFLSIKRFEGQFALYPPGGFYKKHLDQHKGQNHRQISIILYLQNDSPESGQLVLYDKDDKMKVACTLEAISGRFVIFNSALIFHEVLPTQKERYSLTCWLRDDLIVL